MDNTHAEMQTEPLKNQGDALEGAAEARQSGSISSTTEKNGDECSATGKSVTARFPRRKTAGTPARPRPISAQTCTSTPNPSPT